MVKPNDLKKDEQARHKAIIRIQTSFLTEIKNIT